MWTDRAAGTRAERWLRGGPSRRGCRRTPCRAGRRRSSSCCGCRPTDPSATSLPRRDLRRDSAAWVTAAAGGRVDRVLGCDSTPGARPAVGGRRACATYVSGNGLPRVARPVLPADVGLSRGCQTGGMTTPLSPESRSAALDALASEEVDVLVVGGGVTGAGIALDAVTRGLELRADRAARPRLRHLVAVEQADPRRAALPGDARLRPGPRGAPGARAAAHPARAAPGPAGAVPLPAHPPLGAAVRRRRAGAVRLAGEGREVPDGRADAPPPHQAQGAARSPRTSSPRR